MATKKTKKALHDEIRIRYTELLTEALTEKGDEVLRTGANEIAIPCVDSEGNDEYLVITMKVPTGSRDGEAYDGYAMAEDYAIKVKAQAEKAEEARKAKERKIERDKKLREQKAAAKAERTATEGE